MLESRVPTYGYPNSLEQNAARVRVSRTWTTESAAFRGGLSWQMYTIASWRTTALLREDAPQTLGWSKKIRQKRKFNISSAPTSWNLIPLTVSDLTYIDVLVQLHTHVAICCMELKEACLLIHVSAHLLVNAHPYEQTVQLQNIKLSLKIHVFQARHKHNESQSVEYKQRSLVIPVGSFALSLCFHTLQTQCRLRHINVQYRNE